MKLRLLKNNYLKWTDEQLMMAVQQGDVKAFDVLYVRYNESLYYYFYRMLGNAHQVGEDFMQDLFMKLIQQPQLYDCKRSFKTWLFSIAHNMCKNEYRSRKVRYIMCEGNALENAVLQEEQTADNDERVQAIFKVLETLDEHHKTIFLLKYREGFTLDEMVEITDLPKGTVKSRLFYARKKIQEQVPNTSNI